MTEHVPAPVRAAFARLHELGQSPWYDNLARPLLADGSLAELFDAGLRGVTSNPTIFEKAILGGDAYDAQITRCRAAGLDAEDTYWSLVVEDIVETADLLRPTFDAAGGRDGFVSVEVSPHLAHDTDGTCEQVRELFGRVDRPNVMVKIPATAEGLDAIARSTAAGINVNITLIFSLARYEAVIDAFLSGLDDLVARGGDPATISSVASFFVSRVDTETDKRLPDGHALRGKAAVANAKLAYARFRERFSGTRWDGLSARGARVQRPLWASTSTKNKAYSPTLYVDALVGPDTVNTLAPPSIEALGNDSSGLRPSAVTEDVDGARDVLDGLRDAGVDFDDVTATLEREGVDAFSKSYDDALAAIESRRAELASSRG
jgi:transaldolase